MVKYWCKYIEVNTDSNNCLEVGYRSLEDLITDLLEELTNKESTTIQYVLREQCGNKVDYTN